MRQQMTQLTRTQRGLLNVLDGFTILIVFAALILVVYRAVYGATHSLTTAPLIVLTLALILWRGGVMAGRVRRSRK